VVIDMVGKGRCLDVKSNDATEFPLMRGYELVGRRQLRYRDDLPVPTPGAGEIRIRVKACTVCNRSDLAYYHFWGIKDHCSAGHFGHEISGTVDALGPGATRFQVGDRVFVRTPATSGYAEFALARECFVGRLPDSLPFEEGAILQLLPLAIHATRTVALGDTVMIVGAGPVGLMALQAARLRGAGHLSVVDIDPWRLEHASRLGADQVIRTSGRLADLQEIGDSFDVAIDAAGTPDCINACVDVVRAGGSVVMLGTHHVDSDVTFDLVEWEDKRIQFHLGAEPDDHAKSEATLRAEKVVSSGRFDTASLLTAKAPLEELESVLERLSDSGGLHSVHAEEEAALSGPPTGVLKIAITP
jgi:threonine dehydrogenase-like Zn-dependent dehydrogenase